MLCLNCKSALPESAKFCTMCGAKINVSFCPNGHVLEPGEGTCRYCPAPAGQAAPRISVSTTVEKLAEAACAAPLSTPTAVEAQPAPPGAAEPSFGVTRIVQARDEDSVGVLGWLVVIEGAQQWCDFKITKKKTTIGRSRECDFVLENGQVSAKHASIRLTDEGLFLTDLDSSNGTRVNEREVDRHKLVDNDLVAIGDVTMKFKAF